MEDAPYDQIVSLGYRCCSAGIIKSLGLKTASFPFDWLVSRLPVIEHCIQTEFREFLNPDNYTAAVGATHHYSSIYPSSREWVCNESFCFNEFYENTPPKITSKYYSPRPISRENDAYGFRLMMNHRNIRTNIEDQEYFARCVERWNCAVSKRLYLYIHPAMFYEEFAQIKPELFDELRRAHKSIAIDNDGIYIIPVKGTPSAKYVLEEQPDDASKPGCRICILWANLDFIDAGEIFMGNCHVEMYVVKDYLQKTVNNRGLLTNSA